MDGSIPESSRFHILIEFGVRKKVRFLNASSAANYGSDERGFSDDELELKPVCWDEIFYVYGPNEYHKDDIGSLIYRFYRHSKAV